MREGNFRGFELALHDPGIALITFNQPERLNGMTQDMKRDLVEVLITAQMDEAVRVVVFTGSGRAFSAGDDISGRPRTSAGARALVPRIPGGHDTPIGTYEGLRVLSQSLNLAVRNLDKLSIAAINGVAIQTGLSLALSCDFRIASTDARMGSGTLRFGLMPDEGGQFLLVQLMGVARTMDFLMRNRIVSRQEALELGLVHEVVPPTNCTTAPWTSPASCRTARRSRCACSSARFTPPPRPRSRTRSTTSPPRPRSPTTTRTRAKASRAFRRSARRGSMPGSKGRKTANDRAGPAGRRSSRLRWARCRVH